MQLEEVTISELQEEMARGNITARQLTEMYIERIQTLDQHGPTLKSVVEINPDALDIAQQLDQERAANGPRGPLHGIPILLKDNIATLDKMHTTAGSLALLNARPPRDAFVAHKLREAGAVILGKTNLSEWANFRSSHSSSGWSGRGGQTRNPYILDRTPCGSSSGSAVAVAANLTAAALGTETDGSILCPSSINGVVGIKPTVGLTSRAGVIPIAHSQDTVGSFGRTVTDAAIVLGAITGIDPHDPATQAANFHNDYTKFLDVDGLKGARIGVCRQVYFGYHMPTDTLINAGIERMAALGATIIDHTDIPTAQQMSSSESELQVLLYEFKADLNAYLSELTESSVRYWLILLHSTRHTRSKSSPTSGKSSCYRHRQQLICTIRYISTRWQRIIVSPDRMGSTQSWIHTNWMRLLCLREGLHGASTGSMAITILVVAPRRLHWQAIQRSACQQGLCWGCPLA